MYFQNVVRTQQSPADDLPRANCGAVACESCGESMTSCVQYAFNAALHPAHLSSGDQISLHGLGVRWTL